MILFPCWKIFRRCLISLAADFEALQTLPSSFPASSLTSSPISLTLAYFSQVILVFFIKYTRAIGKLLFKCPCCSSFHCLEFQSLVICLIYYLIILSLCSNITFSLTLTLAMLYKIATQYPSHYHIFVTFHWH